MPSSIDDGRNPCDIPAITQTAICRVRSPLNEGSHNVDTNGSCLTGENVKKFPFEGSAAAITGAASASAAHSHLSWRRAGAMWALADLDEAGLASAAKDIVATHGRRATIHRVDVADPRQIQDFAASSISEFRLSTSSSTMPESRCWDNSMSSDHTQMAWLMDINFLGRRAWYAGVHGASEEPPAIAYRQYFEHLRHHRPTGSIRLFGVKIRGSRLLPESLRHELAMSNSTLRLSVVHPGGVKNQHRAQGALRDAMYARA